MASLEVLVSQSPKALGWEFDPVRLIRAVNGLQALGKDGALAALEAVSSDPETDFDPTRLLLILRLLFVAPAGVDTAGAFGRPDIHYPADDSEFNLLPLLLSDDVPFLIAAGFRQGGSLPEHRLLLGEWSEYPMRDTPLSPGTSPDAALERLFTSDRWQKLVSSQRSTAVADRLILMLISQAIRAAGRHGPGPDEAERMQHMSGADVKEVWRDISQALRSNDLEWSADRQEYVPSRAAR